MSNPTPPQNNPVADPSLKDLLDLVKKDIFLALNCHAIATVQVVDLDAQMITASMNYTKTFYQKDVKTGEYVPVQKNYPPLIDIPLAILGGGGAHLTFPFAAGDQAIIFFNDRDFDNWYQSGQVNQSPATPRLHSFSDGIALVALRSSNNPITNYDAVRAVLRNGNAMVGVGTELVKVANELYTLNGLLQALITAIKAITVSTTVTSTPGTYTSGTPINAADLTTIANHLGALLE